MSDLLFWNTLADSVDWLNKEKQAKQFTPKSLIQKILDSSEIAEEPYSPTIIKAILPSDTNIAPVILFPKEGDVGEVEKIFNAYMTREYGALHGEDAVYSGPKFRAAAIPLYPSQLRQLILYGTVEISSIQQGQIAGCRKLRDNECLFILPVGTDHITTIETCGIGRDDLLELLEKLRKLEPIIPKANEVKEADEAQPAAVESIRVQTETKAAQVSATLTEQLKDEGIASLFDGARSFGNSANTSQSIKNCATPAKKIAPWITYCKDRADDIYLSLVSKGKSATKNEVARELETRCKNESILTNRNIPVSKANILRQVFNDWNPPKRD